MKKSLGVVLGVGLSFALLGGCTSTEVGTVGGGAIGAGLGYAVSGGSALGTVIGAGAGAVIGHEVGRNQSRRHYYYY